MRKFFILLKKEIKEILTWQTILPLVLVVIAFYFVGDLIGKESEKAAQPAKIIVVDQDQTATSGRAREVMEQAGFEIIPDQREPEEIISDPAGVEAKALVVLPQGFEQGISQGEPQTIIAYALVKSFSFTGSRRSDISPAIGALNEHFSNMILVQRLPDAEVQNLKNPVRVENFTVINGQAAAVSIGQVLGFITSQSTFIPIILFIVIAFASGTIATSVASEKENKTLETLLAAPIDRKIIVSAKLVAAGLVALLSAGIYIVGLRNYLNGLTGGQSGPDAATSAAIEQLGLTLSVTDYLLLGLALFLGILVALAIAMILGSFAQDTKSVQGVITPLMVLVFIPYIMVFALDFDSLSTGVKYLIYAIPFAHSFLAAPHIMLGDYQFVIYGYIYLGAIFLLAVYIAGKIFASDKILTLRINFLKKRK